MHSMKYEALFYRFVCVTHKKKTSNGTRDQCVRFADTHAFCELHWRADVQFWADVGRRVSSFLE